MVSLCCLGVAGCSSAVNRSSVPAGGPDSFSAGPLPGGGSSTITVKPQAMYNMGGRKPTAVASASKSAPVKSASKGASEPVESAVSLPPPQPRNAEPAPAVAAEPAALEPAAAQGDDADLALPVRKSEGAATNQATTGNAGEPASPQSAVADSPEVLPVSAPAGGAARVDSKFSS
jgi:hypothetical protein